MASSFPENEIKIPLRVQPNAARNEVVGLIAGVLQVRVAAPPVRGKANQELLAFLSRTLGVSQGALAIVKGHTSRSKVITVNGLNREEILKRLSPRPFASSDDARR